MMSSVTGKLIATPDLRSPEYWVKNLVSPVQFARAFKQVCKMSGSKKLDGSHRSQLGVNILLEVGPHAALQAPIRDLLETIHWGRSVHYTAALRRNQPATNTFLDAVGLLNGLGCSVDLSRVNHLAEKWEKHETNRPIITDLPQYPFDHSTSYWRESRIGRRFRLGTQGKLDLLGKPVPDWNELESRWRNYIRVSEMPWVEDHVVDGTLIYPAAGMMAMAIEAANQMADHRHPVNGFELKNIRFMRALVVPRTADGVETNLHLQRLTDDGSVLAWAEFRLFSYTDNAWQENCRGSIKIDYESAPNEVEEENHEVDNFRQEDDRVIQICKHECVTQELYQRLRDSGFDMGPTFQTIQQATFSTDDVVARAKVKVFPWQASQHSQPHVVHPTTLDGLLQVTMAALTEGGKKGFPTAVPTNLRRLWVAKGGLAFPQNESVLAVGRAILHSRGYETEFFALNESRTALLLQAEGIQSTTIANRSKLADETDMSHSCLHLVHLPDVDLLNSKQLAAYCAAHAKPQGPEPVEYYREVDFVLYKFLHDTLAALDKEYAPERVQGYLQKYVAWGRLQREKFANGDLPLSQPQWVQLLSDEAYFKSVCERISSSNAQGYGFVRTGQNLLSILCGEQDALRFLFTQDMMPNFYQEFNRNRVGLDQWEVYLRILAHKNPGLKILEIGAGTGGSTARVLETLFPAGSKRPLYKSYDYTDISPAFFERAAEMYNRFTRINFRTLDIENDASVDEFELGSYDLVIAGSVLHATHIISHTMKNVQKLLKPGGKLMMYEPVRPDIVRSSFIGGLMEGWWSGADDNRIWNPAVTEDQWDAILRETGFSGIDLSLHDYENPDCWECSVILSTAVGLPSCSSNLGAREEETVCFIGDPASSMQRNIFEQGMTALASHLSQAAIIEMRRLEDCVPTKTTTLVFIAETEAPFLHNLKPDVFSKLQSAVSNCANMLWVSAGGGKYCRTPELSVVDGWTRTLRSEKSTRRVGTLALDLNGGEAVSSQQVSHLVKVLMGSILNEGIPIYEAEFVEVDGLLHIPRVIDNPALEDRIFATLQPPQPSIRSFREAGPVRLAIEQHGLLDTLHWTEDKQYNEQDQMQPDEVEVQVQAVGMNFKDCLIALGRMPGETFGQEFAGIVTRAGNNAHFRAGDRVAGGSTESFKTFVRTTANLTCRIPDNFTFAEAASVPTQFFTAWQVIYEIARLKKGESILIHAAAGGTGQASLQIAQSVGAEIYATVGSKAKKDILMTEYGIPADHIFYSRDVSFSRGIMRATKGRGVDVIINSLSGDLLRASWECIGAGGRFVEIGKRDILSNSNLPMAPFGNNATFTHFYASNMLRSNDWTLVTEALFKLFASGQLHIQRPLQVLSISDAEDAFRMMQSGSAAGKIVLQVESQAPVRTILQPKQCLCSLDAQATYVVVGGLGGLGRTIVRWMISRGARNLVLLGRSGATSTKALELLAELKAQHPDIHIETPPCDVVDMGALQHVLQIVTRFMPPIRGCVQAAMVLRDVMFSDMSYEDWHTSLDCKVRGSRNLAQTLPEDMDFFILLSSASGIVGSPGQSNYASGNTYLDGLARSLVAKGRRVISLDLGAMAEDGFLVESAGFLEKVLGYGTLSPVSRAQFYAVLDYYCDNTQPLLEPMTAQVAIGIPSNGGSRGRLADLLADQPLFRYLNICNGSEEDALANSSQKVEYKKQLARAESLQEGRAIVFQALVEKLTRACNLVPENVDTYRHVPIQKLGVDSLLAIEVCNWIGKEFSADVAVFELMGGETLSTVDVLVAQRSQIGHPSWTID
jgi:NADPH:quinone reductase-like Zn-dependent oxidoreductase/NAD(P)-dependent dehydrogenase (short-subunit alcohol dehydrogenase family)/SAM-dependent methyltransferase